MARRCERGGPPRGTDYSHTLRNCKLTLRYTFRRASAPPIRKRVFASMSRCDAEAFALFVTCARYIYADTGVPLPVPMRRCLSNLPVWWLRPDIEIERIKPGNARVSSTISSDCYNKITAPRSLDMDAPIGPPLQRTVLITSFESRFSAPAASGSASSRQRTAWTENAEVTRRWAASPAVSI